MVGAVVVVPRALRHHSAEDVEDAVVVAVKALRR
jgi:hypothetical protein